MRLFPTRSFVPLLVAAAFFAALPVHANPPDDGKGGDKIPWDQMHDKTKSEFDQAKGEFASDPRYSKVVGDAWTFFDKNFFPKLAQGDYPAGAVNRLNQAIKETVLGQRDLDRGNNSSDKDEQARLWAKGQGHFENAKKHFASLADASDAVGKTTTSGGNPKTGKGDDPTTGDEGKGTRPVGRNEVNALTDQVRQAVVRGMEQNPGSSYNPGNPTPGGSMTQPSDQSSPGGLTNIALDKMFKGDPSGALAAADKAVELGGGADPLAVRGGIELDQQQYSKAGQDAKQALQLDPSNQNALAVAHFADGRTDGVASGGAGKEVKGAGGAGGSAGGGAGGSAGGFAGAFGSGGGGPGAGASASLAAGGGAAGGLSRFSPEQAQSAAASAMGMGDYGGALSAVNRALASDPNNPGLLALRASIEGKQKDYAKAEADAKAALAADPKNSEALRTLGYAQIRSKDYKGAMASANELLERNPNDPYAFALRGHAYGSMGDRDAMMADLQRAAELDPRFAAAASKMAGQLQLPDDKDILFLFPGEDAAAPAKTAAPAGRGRSFGLLVGASALGGLLLALGLLHTVFAPLKEQITSAFTRITRTGPTVGETQELDAEARASATNSLMPGLIRGQYEISRQIGVGGMGMVFAGTDRSLGRPVAIKKMRDEMRFDPREKARFILEAKTVAALHHPSIVDIYAIAEEGDDVFLVFEYVEGKTIHDLLQSGSKLTPERAARYTRASAEALEYAHSRGVIHRDMKPSNVMIDGSGAVKVMDFGIARMAKDTMMRQSMTNTIAGTPPYMAPEQEQGRVRSESDVYSLAICAYEMLTGKLPFVGTGGGMLLNKINMSFVAPSRQTAGLSPALDPVFEKAFQADPDNRYRTPRQFADALESALADPIRA